MWLIVDLRFVDPIFLRTSNVRSSDPYKIDNRSGSGKPEKYNGSYQY
jgi:hypothetical protein